MQIGKESTRHFGRKPVSISMHFFLHSGKCVVMFGKRRESKRETHTHIHTETERDREIAKW